MLAFVPMLIERKCTQFLWKLERDCNFLHRLYSFIHECAINKVDPLKRQFKANWLLPKLKHISTVCSPGLALPDVVILKSERLCEINAKIHYVVNTFQSKLTFYIECNVWIWFTLFSQPNYICTMRDTCRYIMFKKYMICCNFSIFELSANRFSSYIKLCSV